jgi:hypothetical protein
MSLPAFRLRFAAALTSVLALLVAPILLTSPVRANVDPCAPTLPIFTYGDLVIAPGLAENRIGRYFEGYVGPGDVDPCPGDGVFEDPRLIGDMHGTVTLADGTTDAHVEWIRDYHFSSDFEGVINIDRERYQDFSVLGRAVFTLWASDVDGNWVSGGSTFYVRRLVQFPVFNAGPEPVRKGSQVKVSGQLTRLVFYASGEAKYLPYQGKRVDVYFRRAGWRQFHYAASTTTTATGSFTRTVTAAYDGCWNAFSPKTDTYVGRFAWVNGDCVDVQ